MGQFTINNWNYAQYTNGNLKAIIGFGASPDILDDTFTYYATVLDNENNEQFQQEFTSLEEACNFLNTKYQDMWDFLDLSKPQETGGCGSCSAH